MSLDFTNWNQDQLDRWYSQLNWREELERFSSLENSALQWKKLLRVLIYGSSRYTSVTQSTSWNTSPNSVIIFKFLLNTAKDHPALAQRLELSKDTINWLFLFVLDDQYSVIHRMTALSIITMVLKTSLLPSDLVELIISFIPKLLSQLQEILPTVLSQKTNPLLLITSQLQEIIQLLTLKYESVILPLIQSENIHILLKMLSITLNALTEAANHESDEADAKQDQNTSNNQQEKFLIQVMTLFSILSDLYKLEESIQLPACSDHSSQEELLQTFNHLVQHLLRTDIVHEIYHQCFYQMLHYYFLVSSDPDAFPLILSKVFEPILPLIAERSSEVEEDSHIVLDLQDLLDLQKIDTLLSFLSCLYEEKLFQKIPSTSVDNASLLAAITDQTVSTIFKLQENLLSIHKKSKSSASQKKKNKKIDLEQLKELKNAYSDLRKGCIACLDLLFHRSTLWIQQHPTEFWKLTTQVLMTPALFPRAYQAWRDSSESAVSSELMDKIYSHLYQALGQIEQYSYPAIEDIFECLKQFFQADCLELVFWSPPSSLSFLAALTQLFHCFPKKVSRTRSNEYRWWTLVLSVLQEVMMMLQRSQVMDRCKSGVGQRETVLAWLWTILQDYSSRLLQIQVKKSKGSPQSRVKMTFKLPAKPKGREEGEEGEEEEEEDRGIEYRQHLLGNFIQCLDTILRYQPLDTASASASIILWEELFLFLQKRMKKLTVYQEEGEIFEDELTEHALLLELYLKLLQLYAEKQEYSLTHSWMMRQFLFLGYYGPSSPAVPPASNTSNSSNKRKIYKQHYQELLATLNDDTSMTALSSSSSSPSSSQTTTPSLKDRLYEQFNQWQDLPEAREDLTMVVTSFESMLKQWKPNSKSISFVVDSSTDTTCPGTAEGAELVTSSSQPMVMTRETLMRQFLRLL